MIDVNASVNKRITLGRQGENAAVRVVFDVSSWLSLEVEGEYTSFDLVNKRPGDDEETYPCVTTYADGKVYWVVKSADVANDGFGNCELVMTVGEAIAKSVNYGTLIHKSLAESDETPAPYQDWVDSVIAAKDTTVTNAASAAESATAAATSETSAAASATSADSSALSAYEYSRDAATSESAAYDYSQKCYAYAESAKSSKGEAVAAKDGAVAAKEAAETEASNALTYRNEAKTYAENAATYAGSASDSASEASGYATNASTYAGKAEEYKDAASGYADSASTSASAASGYADAALASKNEASKYASNASGYATLASGYADNASKSATSASTAKDDAVKAKGLAVNAQTAAETAQSKAEAAQAKAESAQTKAETAASSVSESAAQIETNKEDISDLKEDLSGEITARQTTDSNLAAEVTARTSGDSKLTHSLAYTEERLENVISELKGISYREVVDASISDEKDVATNSESGVQYTEGVEKWADMTMLGGMSRKPRNLFNYTLASLKAYNTVGVWNNNVYTLNGITFTVNDDLTITANTDSSGATATSVFKIINNDVLVKILNEKKTVKLLGAVNSNCREYIWTNEIGLKNDTGNGSVYEIGSNTITSGNVFIQIIEGTVCNNVVFKPMLTTDTSLTYDDYEPYSDHLLDSPVDKVTSTSVDGTTIVEKSIPSTITDLCSDYGIGINEDCYNYIDFENKVYHHVVDTRDYEEGDEDDTSVLTDGTTTYYQLDTEETVDLSSVIDDDFSLLEVEGGGTINFHYPEKDNGYDIDMPSSITYDVDISQFSE